MSRPREHNPVSLFPFLAVLVCAMGALILLLLVTTRRIRSEALARAQAAISAPAVEVRSTGLPTRAPEPQAPRRSGDPRYAVPAAEPPVEAPRPPARPFDPNPALRERIAALSAERDRRRDRLHALDEELHAARQRSAALASRLTDLDRHVDQARDERESARRTIADLEDQQRRLAAQIHELDRRIAESRLQEAAEASRFVVVPYDGVSGTNRRPIFIELAGEGVKFIPENVLLRKEDFEGFTPGYNPLLVGARALVDYWSEQSRGTGEPPPYVLLIVRPSGVRYYPLRLLLERLGQPFGYELLEEDQELALPPRDDGAAAACRLAVERLLQQRNALLAAVRSGGDLDAGAAGGGVWGGDSAAGDSPFGRERFDAPAGARGSDAASSGMSDAGSGPGERRGPVFRGYQRPAYDLVEPDTGIVLPSRQPRVVHRPGPRGAGPGAVVDAASPDRPAVPQPGGMATRPDHPTGTAVVPWSPDRGTGAADGLSGSDGDPRSDDGRGRETLAQRSDGRGRETLAQRSDGRGREALDRRSTTTDSGSGWLPHRTAPPAIPGPAGGGHSVLDTDAIGSLSAPDHSLETLGQSAASGAPGSGWPGGSSGPDGTPAYALPSLPVVPRSPDRGTGATEGLPRSKRTSAFDETQPHHRRWGLSNPRATIGFERKVYIDVSADRVIVAGVHTIGAGRGETRDVLVRRTLEAVDATARSWGPAPEAFYWIPALRFRVAPGGNQHYERLRGPLREWGLPSSATYTLDPSFPGANSFPGGAWERGGEITP